MRSIPVSKQRFIKWASAEYQRINTSPGNCYEVGRWVVPLGGKKCNLIAYVTDSDGGSVRVSVDGVENRMALRVREEIMERFRAAQALRRGPRAGKH